MRVRPTLALILLALTAPPAQAARLSLVGLTNSSEPKSPGIEYTGETAYGAGVLMEFRFIPMFGFELGALYGPRKYNYSTAIPTASKITTSAKAYEFPLLLRLHMGRFFSLGFGGYYAQSKGELTVETDTNGAKSTQNVTFASQNQTDSDFGVATSLALTFRLAPLMRLLFDGRYLIGLKNNSTVAGSDRKYNDMELLAGLQFGF